MHPSSHGVQTGGIHTVLSAEAVYDFLHRALQFAFPYIL